MSYTIFSKSMTWIWEMVNVLVTSFLMHILPHHSAKERAAVSDQVNFTN